MWVLPQTDDGYYLSTAVLLVDKVLEEALSSVAKVDVLCPDAYIACHSSQGAWGREFRV